MTSGGELFVGVDSNIKQSLSHVIVDGDTSTEGSASPDLILSSDVPTLNANAPAFTAAVSTMTPVIITKNVDIGNERWKPNATIVEENVNNILLAEGPQPFIGSDGLYYWPTEIINNYAQPVVVDALHNGVVNGHEGQLYPQQLSEPELVNHAIQSDAVPKDLPIDELKRLIQLQFEYYFSRENLANDSYLVSQMDGDQYVSISTVAKFNQIRKLTSNMDLIVEALKESPYVQLDETEQKVRANMKRCIVILREIPESTPVEEVKALFAHPDCPKWVSFEFAHNDSWYVTFECEDDAKRAYRYLREEVKDFHGRPLMARIKAKTLLSRTVYLPKSVPSSNITITTPTESTAQFTPAPQPINTFTVPPNAVFHQPQTFPFYATAAPVNGNPLLPGTWIAPRQFIQHEIRPKSNYPKHNGYMPNRVNGQRAFYNGGKPRHQFRGNYNNKVPVYDRNGIVENDERQASQFRRGNPNTNAFRKDDPRFARNSNVPKKDYRGNLEESPRFQRLRERRTKDEPTKSPDTGSEGLSSSSDLTLDLALENFPALPSPNSPNENKSASSLKELAAHALQVAQDKSSSEEPSPTSYSDMSETSTDEQMSTSSITTESLLMTVNTSSIIAAAPTSSGVPKISYAQMAQKPNKTTQVKDVFENDKDLPELSSGEPPTKNTNKSDTIKNNNTVKSQRRSSKGSPRTPRSKNSQDNKTNNRSDKNIENISSDSITTTASSVTIKETYASKFGKNVSTKNSPSTQRSNKSQGTNTNRNTSQKINTTNLPPPRPLMSQIIKPPEGKLNEIGASQEQNLFTESFKDDVSVSCSDKTEETKESNKENITN